MVSFHNPKVVGPLWANMEHLPDTLDIGNTFYNSMGSLEGSPSGSPRGRPLSPETIWRR